MRKTIRVGTRKSLLARVQTQMVADKIRENFPDIHIEIVPVSTQGDERLTQSLGSFGGKGVFTKELEEKLLCGEIDLAVHSAKDMPVILPEGLTIGAVLERTHMADVFVTRAEDGQKSLEDIAALPAGFVVGTGSLRRELQIRAVNPALEVKSIRGNVQTRLNKLASGEYDAIILAQAGLERLWQYAGKAAPVPGERASGSGETSYVPGDADFDYSRFAYTVLDTKVMLPAAAQGILAVESRNGDLLEVLGRIDSADARAELGAERAFLQAIGGSCNAPAAALAIKSCGEISMEALYSPDGHKVRRASGRRTITETAGDVSAVEQGERRSEAGSAGFVGVGNAAKAGECLGRRLARELLGTASCGPETSENAGNRQAAMPESAQCGKVWLIGAGPGDLGLVSVRGLECLRQADVIIYDHLAASGLLNEVRDDAQLVYAGKKAGSHYLKQEETNRLIVEYAREGKNVARLKGGDVFVFGRGGEEGLALYEAGIDFEVIPGISSAYAVPAYQGIPVTHRGLASSFHVITGHEDASKGMSVLDYATLAKEEGTLVFLMGLKNLPSICEKLMARGKDGTTPAAVLSSGTTAHQKMASGPLKDIAAIAREQGIKTPAITVVGDVAALHGKLSWYDRRPLAGKSVLITATKPMADAMTKKLSALGAQPVPFSLIHTRPIEDAAVEQAYRALKDYSWLVFTSRNGVDVFFEGLQKRRIDVRSLSPVKFAAIGDGTAKALEHYGFYCDYIPGEYTSAAMAKDWVPALTAADRVLLLRARQASPVLPAALRARNIDFTAVTLYETVEDWRKAPELLRILPDMDYVTLCSASAAAAFEKMTRPGAADGATERPKLVCIGPVTAKAAAALGLKVDLTADVYNIDGIVELICREQRGNAIGDE